MAPATKQQPPKKTHEIVADRLRRKIVSGRLAEGERLPPEDELTAKFGVARTTLREALRVLESQGLLAIRRGRGGGPVVTHPRLGAVAGTLAMSLQLRGTTIGDLAEAHRLIEPQLAGKLAAAHTDADVKALVDVIDVAEEAARINDSMAFGLAAAAVHETLIERSGNVTLATVSAMLHELVQAYYSGLSADTTQALMQRAVRSYRRLVDYIEAGDQQGAIDHWQAQMTFTISNLDPDVPIRLDGAGE